MKTADEIHSELSHVEFNNIEQYLLEVLAALQIPNSTIVRLIASAKQNEFKNPIFVYKRAAILCSDTLPDRGVLEVAEDKITQQHRLVLIIHEEKVLGKDLVTE
jgi:hypothetical protein